MQRADKKDVNIWGVNIRYVQAGEGPVVLLLHGLGASLLTWYCNIDALAEAGFTVLAPDLPGYGDSDKPDHLNYDPASAAEFLHDLTQELGIDRLSVVGSSGGGLVAGLYALEYAEHVDKLVLVAPGGLGRQISWFLRLMSVPLVGELIYRPWIHDRVGFTKQIFHRPPDFLDDLLPEMFRVRGLPGARMAMLPLHAGDPRRGAARPQVSQGRAPGPGDDDPAIQGAERGAAGPGHRRHHTARPKVATLRHQVDLAAAQHPRQAAGGRGRRL